MITNTQRILYENGYYPAYNKHSKHRIEYNGYYYPPSYEEVESNGVWKLELDTCCVSYFSDCFIRTGNYEFKHISSLGVGDRVHTYFAAHAFVRYKDTELVNKVVSAFLGNANAAKYVKHLYKLEKISKFKILNNNLAFLSEFICALTRKTERKGDSVIFYHQYELLQEIYLVLSLFGITSQLRKQGNIWYLEYIYDEFLSKIDNQGSYIIKPIKVLSIKHIPQVTQSFKVASNSNQVVVNTVIVKGD